MIDWVVPILTYDITPDGSRICRSSIELEKPEVKSKGEKKRGLYHKINLLKIREKMWP